MMDVQIEKALALNGVYLRPEQPVAVDVHSLRKSVLYLRPFGFCHFADRHGIIRRSMDFVRYNPWSSLIIRFYSARHIRMGADSPVNSFLQSLDIYICRQGQKHRILIITLLVYRGLERVVHP